MQEIEELIKKYQFEVDYIDESFEDEIEILVIPLREYLQNYPQALDKIIEADRKLIKGYEALSDSSYLKMILKDIYELAQKNVEIHQEVA